MKLTDAEIATIRCYIKSGMRVSDYGETLLSKLLVERDEQAAEIKRLGILIDGALHNTYGPYSDKELLRRVTELLRHATREAAVEEET